MTKTRVEIPSKLRIDVLKRNKHRCCICYQEQVVLHHIDKNPANNVPKNLAVLCNHHHGLAHAHFELSQNYTEDTIRGYKADWENWIDSGTALPAVIVESTAAMLSRIYERQQTALRIVIAEELFANYRQCLERYRQAGGVNADLITRSVKGLSGLRISRWNSLTELGHLQEYVELLAKTYVAIDIYNLYLSSHGAANISARDWAYRNSKVATAIAMSLNPLLISLDRPAVDFNSDFNDTKFIQDFPLEQKSTPMLVNITMPTVGDTRKEN